IQRIRRVYTGEGVSRILTGAAPVTRLTPGVPMRSAPSLRYGLGLRLDSDRSCVRNPLERVYEDGRIVQLVASVPDGEADAHELTRLYGCRRFEPTRPSRLGGPRVESRSRELAHALRAARTHVEEGRVDADRIAHAIERDVAVDGALRGWV